MQAKESKVSKGSKVCKNLIFGTWSMDRVVEAVEPEVSKAEALDPEWFDEEFESRCLKSNH